MQLEYCENGITLKDDGEPDRQIYFTHQEFKTLTIYGLKSKLEELIFKEKESVIMGQEHLDYLDSLRESGITNMYGARPYLMKTYPELSDKEAKEIINYWMENFDTAGTKLTS